MKRSVQVAFTQIRLGFSSLKLRNDILIGIKQISELPNLSVAHLLLVFGCNILSYEQNMQLLRFVHQFIDNCLRF